jgi:hypothetical protein
MNRTVMRNKNSLCAVLKFFGLYCSIFLLCLVDVPIGVLGDDVVANDIQDTHETEKADFIIDSGYEAPLDKKSDMLNLLNEKNGKCRS